MSLGSFTPHQAPSAGLVRLAILALGLLLSFFAVWKQVQGMSKILKMPDGKEFLDALEQFLSQKHNTRAQEMSQQELGFLAVRELKAHVTDDGFCRYFESFSGSYADDALWCLQTVGAQGCADILSRAIAQFPGEKVPDLTDERRDVIAALPAQTLEVWEQLSRDFSFPAAGLDRDLTAFVRANERQFR